MPELSRFEGMVIKMLFNDTVHTISLLYMEPTENIELLLVLTANF